MRANRVILLVIIFTLNNIPFNLATSDSEEEKISCDSIQSSGGKIFPNCSISLIYKDLKDVEERGLEGCRRVSADQILIVTLTELIAKVNFVCESDEAPLDVDIHFEYDTPIVHYTNVKRERVARDFHNRSNYKYILPVQIPTSPLIFGQSSETTLVKYHVHQIGKPSVALNVHFYILHDSWRLERNERVHWMNSGSNLEAIHEIINVPCLTLANRLYLYRITKDDAIIKINATAFHYDPYEGFLLNTSALAESVEGKYLCAVESDLHERPSGQTNVPVKWQRLFPTAKIFSISIPQNFIFSPLLRVVEKDAFYDAQQRGRPFLLNCSRSSGNVTIAIVIDSWRKSGNLEVRITHHSVSKPVPRYFATAALQFRSQDECIRNVENDRICQHDQLYLECRDAETEKRLHNWNIRTNMYVPDDDYDIYPTTEIRYDKIEENFLCEPWGATNVSLQHFQCGNVFQCIQLAKCVTYARRGEQNFRLEHKTCINSVTTFGLTPCQVDISLPENEARTKPCAVAKPLVSRKGILQCIVGLKDGSELFQETYFRGFNGQLYGKDRNYATSAVLEMKATDASDVYCTGGKFRFRCEAHSFFFEDGLVWLFSTQDKGIPKQIPEELITHVRDYEVENDFHDETNSKSIVDILFNDSSVARIYCAAPRVFSRALWDIVSLDVKVEDAIPPLIATNQTNLKFRKGGDVAQSIICRADGLPRPKLQWIFNGKEITENVIEYLLYKVLLFPNFNESMEGEYICNASNFMGQDVRTFYLETDEESSNGALYYTLGGVLAVLIVMIFIVSLIMYRRKKKKEEQYKRLKSIIELLNGTVKNAEEDSNGKEEVQDPIIQLPYDKSFEMVKDSFFIDKNKLLGQGNYGLVYRGSIIGKEGHYAFKILKPEASICDLRTLVYELKILSYIGKHKNVVQLKGAYTKDILKGELCVTTELCGLGSMEDYLRTNRDFFVKNIKKFTLKDNLNNPEHQHICSFSRLLIWCSQIASAMEYLEVKKVVHADLATRNVLLTADAVAKVADFGLSRQTYTDYKYVRTGDEDVAWQWMAVESIKSNIYSSKSDVWSYGITAWEIFSLGAIPYPGVLPPPPENPTKALTFWNNFVDQLENLVHNDKPKFASQEIFEIMKTCWEVDSKQRPSFKSLQSSFQAIVDNWEIHAAQVSETERIVIVEVTRSIPEPMKDCSSVSAVQKRKKLPSDYVQHGYLPFSCANSSSDSTD